ncbi:hypothetical protein [Microcystis phage Mwe-JY25]
MSRRPATLRDPAVEAWVLRQFAEGRSLVEIAQGLARAWGIKAAAEQVQDVVRKAR